MSEAVLGAVEGRQALINTVSLGWIRALNGDGTARIERAFGRYHYGEGGDKQVAAADLPAVPVLMPGLGGGWTIQAQPSVGDRVLLLTVQRQIDPWLEGALKQYWPLRGRMHDVNDTVAVLWHMPTDAGGALVIAGHGAKLELAQDGKITLNEGAAGVVRTGDAVNSSIVEDPVFWAWIGAVGTLLAGMGVVAPVPTALAGKCTGGSTTVRAG
jgi:hypothetical protein